jgi:hypothetical protein
VAIRGRPSRASLYKRLHAAAAELRRRYGGLPAPGLTAESWRGLWLRETHNSTALEGNTLVQREVDAVLERGVALGGRSLKDYLEVRGYADAARWVYAQARGDGGWASDELVTLTEVREVHRLAMEPVWMVAPHPEAGPDEAPGNWRRHEIHTFPGGMRPPSFTDVPALLHDWVARARVLAGEPPILPELLAHWHAEFERIHPFIDGNGRSGRLLLNLLLVRLGYPPMVVESRDRRRYLSALQHADGGQPGPLGELIARAMLDSLERFILPLLAASDHLLPLEALADGDLSVTALRGAAGRSRLRSIRAADGTLRSTREWVEAYRAGRYGALRGPRSSSSAGEA